MHLRRDHADVGSGGQQLRQLAGTDRAGANHHDAAAAEVQEKWKQFSHKKQKPGRLLPPGPVRSGSVVDQCVSVMDGGPVRLARGRISATQQQQQVQIWFITSNRSTLFGPLWSSLQIKSLFSAPV